MQLRRAGLDTHPDLHQPPPHRGETNIGALHAAYHDAEE
jgi:hypothetical protein